MRPVTSSSSGMSRDSATARVTGTGPAPAGFLAGSIGCTTALAELVPGRCCTERDNGERDKYGTDLGHDGSSRSGEGRFQGKQFADCFTAPDQMYLIAIDHHFGGARPGVVVRGHRHAVGAGRLDRQQIAFGQRQFAVVAEEVAGFADRADDFPRSGRLPPCRQRRLLRSHARRRTRPVASDRSSPHRPRQNVFLRRA